jgi:hypothetical protein
MSRERDLKLREPYEKFRIIDHGGLTDITADLHVEVPTQIARYAVGIMAAASSPIPVPRPRGGSGPGNLVSGLQSSGVPTPKGSTLPEISQSTPTPTGSGGANAVSPAIQGGSPAGGGGGGGGGNLPFTGYAVMFTAAVGASFAGAGAFLRSRAPRSKAQQPEAPEGD